MSILFIDENGDHVWFPGNIRARLFHGQALAVARLVGVEAGLGAIEMDEVVIERATFIAFVAAFADWKRHIDSSSNAHAMLDGCFALALALAEKFGATSSYGFGELLVVGRKWI